MSFASFSVSRTLLLVSLCVMGMFFAVSQPAAAAVTGMPGGNIELDGYMWSSTIGWVSFNCKTGGANGANICGTSEYSVYIGPAGNVNGYAWSSNIGWIRFGGLSGFPADSDNPADTVTGSNQARVVGTYPNLAFAGWARACAGTLSGSDACGNMTSRTDGWDGWISLKGASYRLRMQSDGTMVISGDAGATPADGYFWGSAVVGWMAANELKWTPVSATLTAADCEIKSGQSTCIAAVDWDYVPTTVTSPSVTQKYGTTVTTFSTNVAGPKNATLKYGKTTFFAFSGTAQLVYDIANATCVAGTSWKSATSKCEPTVEPVPRVTLYANDKDDKSIVRMGSSVDLTWEIVGDPTSCTLKGPGIPTSYNPGVKSSDYTVSKVNGYSVYTLTCTNSGGSDTDSVTVEVIPGVSEI